MKTYTFKTRVTKWIIRETGDNDHGPWELLWMDDEDGFERSGYYYNAQQAADDVYCQSTGHDVWDYLPTEQLPDGIEDILAWAHNGRQQASDSDL